MDSTTGGRSPVESLRLVRQALGHRGLTDRQRVVLAYLASHDPAQFTPTVGVIAADLWGEDNRRNRDQVRRMLRALEALEVLRTTRGTKGTKYLRPRYVVCLGDGERPSPMPKEDQVPDGEPPSPASDGAAKGGQVTASRRQGDGERQGLRAIGKNNTEKNKEKGSDGGRPSPKRKTLTTEKKPKECLRSAVLELLRQNEEGMFLQAIANKTDGYAIHVKEILTLLRQEGIVIQPNRIQEKYVLAED